MLAAIAARGGATIAARLAGGGGRAGGGAAAAPPSPVAGEEEEEGTPLTLANREAAVREGCRRLLYTSRRAALDALQAAPRSPPDLTAPAPRRLLISRGSRPRQVGFSAARFGAALRLWSVPQLQTLASGSSSFDGAALLGVRRTPSASTAAVASKPHLIFRGWPAQSLLEEWLLASVLAWPERRCRQLLRFCTALEVLPDAGHPQGLHERPITVQCDQTYPVDLGRLPRASTCDRTLHLPPYESREMLEQRLVAAVDSLDAEAFHLL